MSGGSPGMTSIWGSSRQHRSSVMDALRAVLGIDAAWTATQPSGVALVVQTSTGWELKALEASYQNFHALANCQAVRDVRPLGSVPNSSILLAAALAIAKCQVDVVAIDIPLALSRIVRRRASDDCVSRAYGARHCSTHSPSEERPGKISDQLHESFAALGFPLRTTILEIPALIEVYPHPALLELTGKFQRLPYKCGKTTRYWPGLPSQDRQKMLLDQWDKIVGKLDAEIRGVKAALPRMPASARGATLKTYEDKLDAVICAWVGVCVLQNRTRPFGDLDSAIWIPQLSKSGDNDPQPPLIMPGGE
jgi:predicted RNase H-like nuclease